MKFILFLLLLTSSYAFASTPSKEAISSCLGSKSYQDAQFFRIPANTYFEYDEPKNGYTFNYMIHNARDHVEVGLAQNERGAALVFGSSVYPLRNAIVVNKEAGEPYEFFPNLAQWGTVKTPKESYLCVSFNFDGIGRSGSFQNIVGAYLLSKASSKKLYYTVENLKNLSAKN